MRRTPELKGPRKFIFGKGHDVTLADPDGYKAAESVSPPRARTPFSNREHCYNPVEISRVGRWNNMIGGRAPLDH